MKVLYISNLFPDSSEPNRGSYNAQLLQHLAKLCEVRVLSPRSTRGFPPFWFPKKRSSRLQDKFFAPVFPPVAYVPKFGSRFNHLLMARCIEPTLKKIREEFAFDVVLSSWIYPDACAASELAARHQFPFVAIAQGSDVHQYLKMPTRRKIIVYSLNRASAVISRSNELARQLENAGVQRKKIQTVYNGVDFEIFSPGEKLIARNQLNLPEDSSLFLFVGNFLPIKNPLLLVEAHAVFCRLHPKKNAILLMIGTGPLREIVQERARLLGIGERVKLLGARTSSEVAKYMQAADALCVPSDNEGLPNVILEAFASGLPVVARRVGGIPEIFTQDSLGQLVEGNAKSMAEGMAKVVSSAPQINQICEHARQYSWTTTTEKYRNILECAVVAKLIAP